MNGAKITAVRCIRLHGVLDEPIGIGEESWLDATEASLNPFRDWRPDGHRNIRATFVEIETDDGLRGHSRAIGQDVGRIVCRELAARLMGREPGDVEGIWDELAAHADGRRETSHGALLAVDMALWDLAGKAAGVPVYRLLGGKARSTIPVYASTVGCSHAPRKLRERALHLKRSGFPAQKWFFRYGPDAGEKGKAENLRLVREVRAVVGEEYPLMFDATFGWNESYAFELAQAMAAHRPRWLEDPVAAGEHDALTRLRGRIGIPLAAGDRLRTCDDVRRFLERGSADVFQPDEGALGGITPMVRVAAICREYGIPFVPHCGDMATLHVLAAQDEATCPYFEFLLLWYEVGQWFYQDRYLPENGAIAMPDVPGLGISIDGSRVTRTEEIL